MCLISSPLSLSLYRFMMREHRLRGITNIGFIDPFIVYKAPQSTYARLQTTMKEQQDDNLKHFLEMHRNKDEIFFPYNFR